LDFQIGTVELLLGQPEAAQKRLLCAENMRKTAEGCNNLGVAEFWCGKRGLAMKRFELSLKRFPDYLDARLNLSSVIPCNITTHPLRTSPSRIDYSMPID
jgi:hypothetical protein